LSWCKKTRRGVDPGGDEEGEIQTPRSFEPGNLCERKGRDEAEKGGKGCASVKKDKNKRGDARGGGVNWKRWSYWVRIYGHESRGKERTRGGHGVGGTEKNIQGKSVQKGQLVTLSGNLRSGQIVPSWKKCSRQIREERKKKRVRTANSLVVQIKFRKKDVGRRLRGKRQNHWVPHANL